MNAKRSDEPEPIGRPISPEELEAMGGSLESAEPRFIRTSDRFLNINIIRSFKMSQGSLELTFEEHGELISVYVHDNAQEAFNKLKAMSIN
jgi:uncharacterized protein YvpB